MRNDENAEVENKLLFVSTRGISEGDMLTGAAHSTHPYLLYLPPTLTHPEAIRGSLLVQDPHCPETLTEPGYTSLTQLEPIDISVPGIQN